MNLDTAVAIFITYCVLAGVFASEPAVRNARPLVGPAGATLVRPALYTVFAPLSDVLDGLSLLSVPVLIALVASVFGWYALVRVWLWRHRATNAWCEFCAALRLVLISALLIILAAVMPRPMAAIHVDDPDAVVFDVHSHTNFSHDARSTFTVEANRAWHRAAGFDVAYVTDHRCFDGAAEGMRANPKRAGDGTVILSGIELPADQRHVIVLEPPDAPAPAGLMESWCVRAKTARPAALPPLRIQSIPEDLSRMVPAALAPDSGVIAIEASDGAPRGMAQSDADADAIILLASKYDLARVAASNNHGWGRTAVAWNVMRIPGWRALAPDSLGTIIAMRIRAERGRSVRVIERNRVVPPDHPVLKIVAFPFTPVAFLMWMFGTMSMPERISWLAWAWGITGVVVLVRRVKK